MSVTLYTMDGRDLTIGPTFHVLSTWRHFGELEPEGYENLVQVPHLTDPITPELLDGIADDAAAFMNAHRDDLSGEELDILHDLIALAEDEEQVSEEEAEQSMLEAQAPDEET